MMTVRSLIQFLLVSFSLAISSSVALAASYSYDHNGSRMRVDVEGSQVSIYYQTPRAGLSRVGVRANTLLFNGRVTNGYLEGMSRIFNANCGEVDYFVYGDFVAGQNFRLNGAAPVLSNMSCRIVNNVTEGPNSNLVFTALGGTTTPQAARVQSGCVKNVRTTLNVRVGPGSSFGRIGEIPAGTCGVRVMDRCQDNWCAVQSGNLSGWVSMRYLQQ